MRALAVRQVEMLSRLAEIGLNIAGAMERRLIAQADSAEAAAEPEPGLAFGRVARAVRLTLALQSRLVGEIAALDEAASARGRTRAAETAQAAARAERAQADARLEQADRIIRRAIAGEHADKDVIEQLSGEAWERLENAEAWGDLLRRPMGEVVARICGELGLSPEAGRRAWVQAGEMGEGVGEDLAPQAGAPPGCGGMAADRTWDGGGGGGEEKSPQAAVLAGFMPAIPDLGFRQADTEGFAAAISKACDHGPPA